MPTQEIQTVTKEAQKIVLKALCEYPTLTIEELTIFLKTRASKISQEEIIQVVQSISPTKNWHRASQEEIQREVIDYVWTLETQILFLLPTKQKETTIAEFNQLRLQNKQPKVPKDVIRHLQAILMVDGKSLGKFRKFQKELSLQNDLDINTQAVWLSRIVLVNSNFGPVSSVQELQALITQEFKEKFPTIAEKVGKTLQRITEKFVEKYFPKNTSGTSIRELITNYQNIYNNYKKAADGEVQNRSELKDQNKLIDNIIEQLKEVQDIVNESHEGGFLSKLFTGQIKNREGIIKKIDHIINSLTQVNDLNSSTNRLVSEKAFLLQKLQSDYENIVFVKNQLEHDLSNLNEKLRTLEEKDSNVERELQDKTEMLENLHEKIASLQQKVDKLPELEAKTNVLRDDLISAKTIAVSLYLRLNKLKDDLLKQNTDKVKTSKINGDQKIINGNQTIHKFQQSEGTGEIVMNTEVGSGI